MYYKPEVLHPKSLIKSRAVGHDGSQTGPKEQTKGQVVIPEKQQQFCELKWAW